MQGKKNPELDARICAAWQSGRYKKLISLARMFHVSPKAISRALQRGGLAENNYGRKKPAQVADA